MNTSFAPVPFLPFGIRLPSLLGEITEESEVAEEVATFEDVDPEVIVGSPE